MSAIGNKMNKLFKITPLEEKGVEVFYSAYQELSDGTIRNWAVTETYLWGHGFRRWDDDVYDDETDCVRCDISIERDYNLTELCGVWFEFDSSFTEEEKTEIQNLYNKGDQNGLAGSSWLFEGKHNWSVDDSCIYILGPVKIDVINANHSNDEVVFSNIEPKPTTRTVMWDDHDEEDVFKLKKVPKGHYDE